jgi:hypothetical protein
MKKDTSSSGGMVQSNSKDFYTEHSKSPDRPQSSINNYQKQNTSVSYMQKSSPYVHSQQDYNSKTRVNEKSVLKEKSSNKPAATQNN